MRQYLSTLHERPHSHKKRFALVTAGSFTLLIFAIWALATFGAPDPTPANANAAIEEVSPLGSLMRGVGVGFKAMMGTTNELKEGLEVVNFQQGYEDMKNNSINNYGQ